MVKRKEGAIYLVCNFSLPIVAVVIWPMKEVFGIIPFSSNNAVLKPKVRGARPVNLSELFLSVISSVINLNSNFLLMPYFHKTVGVVNTCLLALTFSMLNPLSA